MRSYPGRSRHRHTSTWRWPWRSARPRQSRRRPNQLVSASLGRDHRPEGCHLCNEPWPTRCGDRRLTGGRLHGRRRSGWVCRVDTAATWTAGIGHVPLSGRVVDQPRSCQLARCRLRVNVRQHGGTRESVREGYRRVRRARPRAPSPSARAPERRGRGCDEAGPCCSARHSG